MENFFGRVVCRLDGEYAVQHRAGRFADDAGFLRLSNRQARFYRLRARQTAFERKRVPAAAAKQFAGLRYP